ncbi:MAG: preprotein translocase subunit YajC [Planctomycetota bacterium]
MYPTIAPLIAQAAEPSGLEALLSNPLIPLLVVGMLFYVMLWRPERQKRNEHLNLVNNLKSNDRVITAGGIYGTVVNSQQGSDHVTLRIDENSNTRIRVARTSISRVLTGETESASKES